MPQGNRGRRPAALSESEASGGTLFSPVLDGTAPIGGQIVPAWTFSAIDAMPMFSAGIFAGPLHLAGIDVDTKEGTASARFSTRSQPTGGASGELGVTARELGILGLIAAGVSNREIAGARLVSVNRVKTHSRRLFGEPGAASESSAFGRGERQLHVLETRIH